jgi:hypothetical protein
MYPLRTQQVNAGIGLWRWYINITITILDIIHSLNCCLKQRLGDWILCICKIKLVMMGWTEHASCENCMWSVWKSLRWMFWRNEPLGRPEWTIKVVINVWVSGRVMNSSCRAYEHVRVQYEVSNSLKNRKFSRSILLHEVRQFMKCYDCIRDL